MYSSGEDLIKPRKPYTITKQRERWTEEEHNRFIEALKLHGRAWQRIEEHIGTKTAVQIRSHAQKFFTKLEKEAQIKGVPLKQTLDIDIPPPRPKKKPSNPYPRKTNGGTSQEESVDGKLLKSTTVLYNNKQILDLETPPSEDGGTEKSIRAEALNEGDRSEVLTLFQEVPCTSMSTASKISPPFTNRHAFKEFMPLIKDTSNHGLSDEYESCATVERRANLKFDRSQANYKDLDNSMSGISNLTLSTDKVQVDQDCPRQAPIHIVNVSSGIVHPEPIHQLGAAHGSSSLFSEPTVSAASQHHSNIPGTASHQLLPDSCPSLTSLCNNQDTTQIFSNLIISTLLQNPAAHAAASLAASLWPCRNLAVPIDSPVGSIGGFPPSYMGPPQSMTAIAAATIAAASAWWAAHGVFPLCPPLHTGCMSVPSSITTAPAETIQAPIVSNEMKETISHDSPRGGVDEALEVQGSDPKWSPPSLSESEESGDAVQESNPMKTKDLQQDPPLAEVVPESSKGKARGQVNRSSCGSNTPSSSELDTSGLDKQEKRKEDLTNPDANNPSGFELNNHRNRFTGNINESWKEVSEEGRIAFQALFSREVLPQSFLRSNDARSKEELNNGGERYMKPSEKDEETKLQLGPSSKLSLGDEHGKLKGGYRTGFKPYKRCSSEEAKESRVMMNEEKGNKRIRLDGVVASNS